MTWDPAVRADPVVAFQTGRAYGLRHLSPAGGFLVVDDHEQLAAVIEDVAGRAQTVDRHWTSSIRRSGRSWSLVVSDAHDDRPIAVARPRGEITRYRIDIGDETVAKLRANPLTGTWRLSSRQRRIASISTTARFYDGRPNRSTANPDPASAGTLVLGGSLPAEPSRSAAVIAMVLCMRVDSIYNNAGVGSG